MRNRHHSVSTLESPEGASVPSSASSGSALSSTNTPCEPAHCCSNASRGVAAASSMPATAAQSRHQGLEALAWEAFRAVTALGVICAGALQRQPRPAAAPGMDTTGGVRCCGIANHWGAERPKRAANSMPALSNRSEEHTSELQSHLNLVCRLLLENKKAHLSPPATLDTPIPSSPSNIISTLT